MMNEDAQRSETMSTMIAFPLFHCKGFLLDTLGLCQMSQGEWCVQGCYLQLDVTINLLSVCVGQMLLVVTSQVGVRHNN